MNAADLARLELAKRAYRAAQPNESEIQTGVRRARLALGRPKRRRAWFSKGLVFVVLAVGSLAYAKPHALGDLVAEIWPHGDSSVTKPGVGAAAFGLPPELATASRGVGNARAKNAAQPSTDVATTTQNADGLTLDSANAPGVDTARALNRSSRATPGPIGALANPATASKQAKPSRHSAAAAAEPAKPGTQDAAVSDWGRVGQALARGDETQALAALGELSESDNQRTRDKADVGRAQLLLARGDRAQACALARALTNRRAGSGIERQAQALLKSCAR